MSFHHRPTLKQQNKPFKSKHATKSSLKDAAKGRVQRTNIKTNSSNHAAAQTRANRRNAAKQLQLKKRHDLVEATRIFNGTDGAPRIVAVIPLCPDLTAADTVKAMATALTGDASDVPPHGVWRLKVDRFKTSVQFVLLPYRQLYAALDACKAADYVVFLLSSEVEVDPWGDLALRCLQAQGLPEVITVTQSPSSDDARQRAATTKSLLSFIQYFVPTQQRVFDLSVPAEGINAARGFCEGRPKPVKWREGRGWILADATSWEQNSSSPIELSGQEPRGTLRVDGVIRGAPLSADRLVHIPNFGDFQVDKIMASPNDRRRKAAAMDVEPAILSERTDDGDSLTSRLEPDTMNNEQTWPTEEEMNGSEATSSANFPPAQPGTTPKAVRRVPKGTSAYQSAWIIDEEDEDGEDEGGYDSADDGEDDEMAEVSNEPEAEKEAEMSDEEEEEPPKSSVAFQDFDMDEENEQLESWRESRAREREDHDDLEFPDELDTPKDIPARTRFQRYRGLRSFRTSPWDPYENLPIDYARIFQFEDYERTKRKVRKLAEESGVDLGTQVSVYIRDVPQSVISTLDPRFPFTIFTLLPHEHKYSVLNYAVQRNTEYDGSVRSKDPLILSVGARRYRTNPVYSDHQRGGAKGANNVHKFERYLRHGGTSVATVFGPIVFGKQPCLLLRETDDPEAPALVASGTFLNTDPKRIIAKRIILTGHPFKVNRKTATIRYMFFNPDDVSYFAPIQLHTKHGRTGHISESLGTHGYFKAHFDGQINQMDTVCLSLYKRVFPKWAELWRESRFSAASSGEAQDVVMRE